MPTPRPRAGAGESDTPDWQAALSELSEPVPESDSRVSMLFFAGYATTCALSMGGGVFLGIRSFEARVPRQYHHEQPSRGASARVIAL